MNTVLYIMLDLFVLSHVLNHHDYTRTARSGEAIRVLVYPEDEASKKLIEAVRTLSNDGKSFSVVATREDSA